VTGQHSSTVPPQAAAFRAEVGTPYSNVLEIGFRLDAALTVSDPQLWARDNQRFLNFEEVHLLSGIGGSVRHAPGHGGTAAALQNRNGKDRAAVRQVALFYRLLTVLWLPPSPCAGSGGEASLE
jgi:hypothetical protein